MATDEQRQVVVELEADDGPPGWRRTSILVAGGIGLVAVVVLVLGLRPEAGQNADGTERATTPPSTTTSTAAPPSVERRSGDLTPVTGLDVGANEWFSIAERDGRLVGLREGSSDTSRPFLFESSDGISWQSLTPVWHEGDWPAEVGLKTRFTRMITTTDGFAMLMYTFDPDTVELNPLTGSPILASDPRSAIRQIVSDDGVRWRPGHDPLGQRGEPWFHHEDWVVLADSPTADPFLSEALDAVIAVGVEYPDPCSALWTSTSIFVTGCDGTEVTLTKDDFVSSEEADRWNECGAALGRVESGGVVPLTVQHLSSSATTALDPREDLIVAWAAHGGWLFGLDLSGVLLAESADECLGLIEYETSTQLIQIGVDGAKTSIPLPEGVTSDVLGLVELASGPAVWTRDALHQYDMAYRTWRAIGLPPGTWDLRASADGRSVGALGDAAYFGNLETGEWVSVDLNEPTRRASLHVTDEVLVLRQADEIVAIRPDTGSLAEAAEVDGLPRGSDLMVVEAAIGYLGMVDPPGGGPNVYRSLDGITWQQVEVSMPPLPDQLVAFTRHGNLISIDTGFALVRVNQRLDSVDGLDMFEVQRLVSNDGQNWVFENPNAIFRGPGRVWSADVHGDTPVVASSAEDNGFLKTLIAAAVTEEAQPQFSPCWIEVNRGRIFVGDCHGSGEPLLIEGDAVLPDTDLEALEECASAIGSRPWGITDVTITDTDTGDSTRIDVTSPFVVEVAVDGNAVVLLDAGKDLYGPTPDVCIDFLRQTETEPALIRYVDGELVSRTELPQPASTDSYALFPTLWPRDSGVDVWVGDALVRPDPAGGWETVLELPEDVRVDARTYENGSNGSLIGILTTDSLLIGDASAGGWTTHALDVQGEPRRFVYLGEGVALIETSTRTYWVNF